MDERDAERVADGHAGVAGQELRQREAAGVRAPGLRGLRAAAARLGRAGRQRRRARAPRDAQQRGQPRQQEPAPQQQRPAGTHLTVHTHYYGLITGTTFMYIKMLCSHEQFSFPSEL